MTGQPVTIRVSEAPPLQVLACGLRGAVRDWVTGVAWWHTVVVDQIRALTAAEGLEAAVAVVHTEEWPSELVRWVDALRAVQVTAPIVVTAHKPSARFMRTALGLHVWTVVPDERLDLLAVAIERAAQKSSQEAGQRRTIWEVRLGP